jgi:RNA polymerase sigma-70 factor (ECF subfamily)
MPAEHAILAEIPRLRRCTQALTGNAADADDLLQDTLERALANGCCGGRGNLRAWLLTMMHHVFLNQLQPAGLVTLDDDAPAIPVRPQQQDELEVRDLDRALGCLPDQQEVLLLVGLEESATPTPPASWAFREPSCRACPAPASGCAPSWPARTGPCI